MISNEMELYHFLDNVFKGHGYVRKKDTYYIHSKECICFFHITKSSFGGQYDHFMGCFLNEINKEKGNFPAYNKCHLRYSLRELADKELVKKAFDLENKEFSNHQREDVITGLINNLAVKFLEDVSTKDGIIKAINKYEDLIYRIKGDLFTHLKLSLLQ